VTVARFSWQQDRVRQALNEPGDVLNVGCNEDPAGLKDIDPDRVINCDLLAHDRTLDRANRVDVLFDAAEDRWPFSDRQACLVVLGDIVEHLTADELERCLAEARRVGRKLAITCPEDDRPETFQDRSSQYDKGAVHVTVVTHDYLAAALARTGWTVVSWDEPDYGFVPKGHFVLAD
jgi:hypothetical protein